MRSSGRSAPVVRSVLLVAVAVVLALGPSACGKDDKGGGSAKDDPGTFGTKPKVTVPITAFSSDHGAPEQRFYNLVCIAYGFDPKIFADVVDKGYLPDPRAKVCKYEYSNLSYAISKLVGPHIDQDKAEKAFETTETWSSAPFWHRPAAPQALQEPQAQAR